MEERIREKERKQSAMLTASLLNPPLPFHAYIHKNRKTQVLKWKQVDPETLGWWARGEEPIYRKRPENRLEENTTQ